MMNLEIRTYKKKDKAALVQLLKLNVPQYFAKEEVVDFENYLDNEIEQYFVAESKGEILGAGGINYAENSTIGKISWDFIHPDYHGKGIGTQILQHRIKILKGMPGLKSISVRTSQLAYTFYEKNGFILKETQKDFWAKGFDLYYMIYSK